MEVEETIKTSVTAANNQLAPEQKKDMEVEES
jgi:hypothetical protein